MKRWRRIAGILCGLVLLSGGSVLPAFGKDDPRVRSEFVAPLWLASPSFRRKDLAAGERTAFDNETVWQDIRVQADASKIRLRLTNELGDEVVDVAAVTVVAGSITLPVLFGGKLGVRLAPGEARASDFIALKVRAFDDLSVGSYYAVPTRPVAHRGYVRVQPGASVVSPASETVRGPTIVTAIESVGGARPCGSIIVAVGDSITQGVGAARNNDWPSVLARRFTWGRCAARVLNAGIGGNRLMSTGGSPSLLDRLDRDVLSLQGVTHVILLAGINDIRAWSVGASPRRGSAGEILDAYRQVVARAHARGLRVIGGTITPHEGATNQDAETLAIVNDVNNAIRSGAIFDAHIDFNAAIANRTRPDRMLPQMSSGDWLHPSDHGYKMMAFAVPLGLFDPVLTVGRAKAR